MELPILWFVEVIYYSIFLNFLNTIKFIFQILGMKSRNISKKLLILFRVETRFLCIVLKGFREVHLLLLPT